MRTKIKKQQQKIEFRILLMQTINIREWHTTQGKKRVPNKTFTKIQKRKYRVSWIVAPVS